MDQLVLLALQFPIVLEFSPVLLLMINNALHVTMAISALLVHNAQPYLTVLDWSRAQVPPINSALNVIMDTMDQRVKHVRVYQIVLDK
jgi:hypothetical protein